MQLAILIIWAVICWREQHAGGRNVVKEHTNKKAGMWFTAFPAGIDINKKAQGEPKVQKCLLSFFLPFFNR